MKNFHDNAHANSRLTRCYVAVKDKDGTFNVARVQEATKNKIWLNDGNQYDLQDERVHIVFQKLGYVNTRHQCVLLSRTPKRMWKAGIVPENIQMDYLHPQHMRMSDRVELGVGLEFILNHRYPSFRKACLEVSTGKHAARAFHPNFAVSLSDVSDKLVIYYNNFEIGYVDDGDVFVGDVYDHLKEQIFEATGKESIS